MWEIRHMATSKAWCSGVCLCQSFLWTSDKSVFQRDSGGLKLLPWLCGFDGWLLYWYKPSWLWGGYWQTNREWHYTTACRITVQTDMFGYRKLSVVFWFITAVAPLGWEDFDSNLKKNMYQWPDWLVQVKDNVLTLFEVLLPCLGGNALRKVDFFPQTQANSVGWKGTSSKGVLTRYWQPQ